MSITWCIPLHTRIGWRGKNYLAFRALTITLFSYNIKFISNDHGWRPQYQDIFFFFQSCNIFSILRKKEKILSLFIARNEPHLAQYSPSLGGSDEGVYNCTLHIVPQIPSHIDSAQRCLRVRVIASYWGHISITNGKRRDITDGRKKNIVFGMFWLDPKYCAVVLNFDTKFILFSPCWLLSGDIISIMDEV